jgi:TIR domain
MHSIFISYPDHQREIVDSLRDCLSDLGIRAWVYSHDRTIARDAWDEIKEKIESCKMVIYVVSKESVGAEGQRRELDMAIDLLSRTRPDLLTVPVLVGDMNFSTIPKSISHVNGLYLDAFSKKSTALELAKLLSPDIAGENWAWRYPHPSQWLEVCNLDQWTEEFFDLGDYVYFRRLSPMGFFECYSPKLDGLFWFYSKNLRPAPIVDEDGAYERENVPREFRVITMIMKEFERR